MDAVPWSLSRSTKNCCAHPNIPDDSNTSQTSKAGNSHMVPLSVPRLRKCPWLVSSGEGSARQVAGIISGSRRTSAAVLTSAKPQWYRSGV